MCIRDRYMGEAFSVLACSEENREMMNLHTAMDEAMFKFDLTQHLYYSLADNVATPTFLSEVKKSLGEEAVDNIIKEVEAMPEEKKEAIRNFFKKMKQQDIIHQILSLIHI
eukprot:TRINITY_DN4554_c0_g1_i7.p1 TRINITY_DN4554_c0_g1~~TRINITY_DN4554_c0_g1_i7.p1  ORF type:complete len:111 (+),score=26.17 TRINITY_DN4554_c0_g1_i7:161-493(+)